MLRRSLLFAFVGGAAVRQPYCFSAILIPFLILSLAAFGLNILVGYCGQISLGTGGFMAVGATPRTTSRCACRGSIRWWRFCSRAVAALVGILFGIPACASKASISRSPRSPRSFFSTGCSAEVAWFTNYTPSGSLNAPAITLFGFTFDTPVRKYLLVLASSTVFALVARRISCAANVGRSWMAIRDMDVAAEIIGIRPLCAKLSAFAVSSFLLRRGRRAVGVRPPGPVGAAGIRRQPVVQPAVHGHHRRAGLHPRQLPGRGVHHAAAAVAATSSRRGWACTCRPR